MALYDRPVLEPLNFASVFIQTNDESSICDLLPLSQKGTLETHLTCLLCDVIFPDLDLLLKHLAVTHHLIISDVSMIADFRAYLIYWKKRFSESPLTEFCSVVQTNSKPTYSDPSELYYLLCDALPEDHRLRIELQRMKLQQVLDQQQKERDDKNFSRDCLFCNYHFEGNRSDLFEHMAEWHHFNVGLPDNLVYIAELLDILEEKLRSLKCLYCEKTFKDSATLKEHMRKKRHKRFRTTNVTYHRFFIANYLEPGKNLKDLTQDDRRIKEDDELSESDDSSCRTNQWNDWADISDTQTVCLFCKFSSDSSTQLTQHLQLNHNFDLPRVTQSLNLNFYQKIKLVNYIRRQIHQNICHYCLVTCSDEHVLGEHIFATGHMSRVPDISIWDQPQYFFPTYEDDNLLCLLCTDDDDDLENPNLNCGPTSVVAEDLPVVDDSSVLKELLNFDQLSLKSLG